MLNVRCFPLPKAVCAPTPHPPHSKTVPRGTGTRSGPGIAEALRVTDPRSDCIVGFRGSKRDIAFRKPALRTVPRPSSAVGDKMLDSASEPGNLSDEKESRHPMKIRLPLL